MPQELRCSELANWPTNRVWSNISLDICLSTPALSISKPSTPEKLTWNMKITQLKQRIIFQTSMFEFNVNFPGRTFQVFVGGEAAGEVHEWLQVRRSSNSGNSVGKSSDGIAWS